MILEQNKDWDWEIVALPVYNPVTPERVLLFFICGTFIVHVFLIKIFSEFIR